MSRLFRTQHKTASAPGTMIFTGEKKEEKPRIRVIDFDGGDLRERELETVDECAAYHETDSVSWINIDGLHDTQMLSELGARFGLHPLVLEDIVGTHQRPKLEDYQDYLFIVCRMMSFDETSQQVVSEQVSFVLGRGWVLSFQERVGDVFEPVRNRLRSGKGRIRTAGADYLTYALIDAVVDHYFVVLERIGDRIEDLDDEMIDNPEPDSLETIHALKREMIVLRRSVWPLREVVGGMERSDSDLVREATRIYLRDVYDHTVQVADVVESFRDLLSGLQDLYLSSISNKMNEVMKVLTIAATIFVPLTFFAGIYGMNFKYMPELEWKWSYPIFWGVILVLGGLMLVYFRRRRWL